MNEYVLFSWLMRRLMKEQNEDRFNNLKIRITTFAHFANKSSEINGSRFAIDWMIDNGVIIDVGFEFFKLKKEMFLKYCSKNDIKIFNFNRKFTNSPKLSVNKIKADQALLNNTLRHIQTKAYIDRLKYLEDNNEIIINNRKKLRLKKPELTKKGRVPNKNVLISGDNFENKTP